jgi:hypothetical protein
LCAVINQEIEASNDSLNRPTALRIQNFYCVEFGVFGDAVRLGPDCAGGVGAVAVGVREVVFAAGIDEEGCAWVC